MAETDWIAEVHENIKSRIGMVKGMEKSSKVSIYKLPAAIKDLNKKAFEPQAVSFGPYHHGKTHLQSMEEHKHRALSHFLKRSEKPLASLVYTLAEVVQELKESYYPLDLKWCDNDNSFLELMIVDGCFMVELLLTYRYGFDGYDMNDPIFSKHGKLYIMPYIGRDMLMLENQLPMLLIEGLLTFTGNILQDDQEYVNKLIITFFPNTTLSTRGLGRRSHVLDVYRKSKLQHDPPRVTYPFGRLRKSADEAGSIIMRSATELQEAGICFKKSRTHSLKDISFCKGILSLPPIIVDDTTETTFLNLLAFERLHVGAGNEVSSYAFFMDNIIDSEKDIAILSERGIIQNAVGSDKAAADLFNSLAKDAALDPECSLEELQEQVYSYSMKPWNRWRANLIHTYFRNPWALISLIAAVVLFVLAAGQTVLSILQYVKDSKESLVQPVPGRRPPRTL